MTKIIKFIPLLCFILLVVFFMRGLFLDPHTLPSVQVGRKIPDFTLSDLNKPHAVVTPSTILGRAVLLNVWASWCDACALEQTVLLQLAHMGVPIYGLNYKDSTTNALAWLKDWGNPYIAIGADEDGKVALDLGVYGAPETFLIDKHGVIRARHVGVLTKEVWQQMFAPLMIEYVGPRPNLRIQKFGN